jgi:uncharacterized protein YbjT (DUF2867 family)
MDTSSPSVPLVAITGATGEIGGRVARRLAGTAQLRLLSRSASRARELAGVLGTTPGRTLPGTTADAGPAATSPTRGEPGTTADAGPAATSPTRGEPGTAANGPMVESAGADYGDFAAMTAALQGADVVLMVSAAESADRLEQHATFLRAARQAGVGHLVYTSFLAAAPDAVFTLARDHFATEELIAGSGIPHTILRDNFYQDVFPLFAGKDGILRGPAGTGRVSAVARDDVAACAAVVLAEAAHALAAGNTPAHVGRTYDLTGPEAFTLHEAAVAISETTGRQVRYVDETLEEAAASRAGYGAPPWQLDAWISTYTAIGSGQLAAISEDVPSLLGRPAQSLRETLGKSNG